MSNAAVAERAQSAVERFTDEWDRLYATTALTDWELLPAGDLGELVFDLLEDGAAVRSILELGCGRGLRAMVAMLALSALNRPDVRYLGLDHSRRAIGVAQALVAMARTGAALPEPFHEAVWTHVPTTSAMTLKATAAFETHDVFAWLAAFDGPRFDLVVDWMCFHELHPEMRAVYAAGVAKVAADRYVLKTFSVEGSSVRDLGPIDGVIPKYQVARSDIDEVFGPYFTVERMVVLPEDLTPDIVPSDKIIAAKAVYVMRRRDD